MRLALFRAPVADVRAQLASLLGERTVADDRVNAQPADRSALDAAGRTVIFAFLTHHVRETVAALGRAVVAGVDAVFGALVRRIAHVVFRLDQRAQFPGRLDNNVRFKLQGRPCRLLIQIKHTSYRHPPASLVKTVYMQTISPSVRFTVRSVHRPFGVQHRGVDFHTELSHFAPLFSLRTDPSLGENLHLPLARADAEEHAKGERIRSIGSV